MNDLLSLSPLAMLLLAGVLCVGIFAQAASGFAAGLLIITTLVWFGYPIPEAQALLIVATIPQNLWGAWEFRESISPKQIAWPAFGRLLFLPLGILLLEAMESLSVETIKQLVSGIMLAITMAVCVLNPRPRQRLPWGWGWLSFPLSGFLQGLVGMGGPAMVLWVQAHDWDTKRSRGFLFAMYLVNITPALTLLYYKFGNRIVTPSLIASALIPLLLVATWLGLRAGTWLGRKRLRTVSLGILILIGIAGLAAPWMSAVRR